MDSKTDLLLESLRTPAFLLDPEGFITYANQATAVSTGFGLDELLNQYISLVTNNGDKIKSQYELEIAASKGNYCADGWRTRKDGSRFWGELRIAAVYSSDKVVKAFSCLIVDRTDKLNREVELRDSEQRYRLMVEGVKDYAIFMLDPQGNIVTWNEGASKNNGYSSNEIIGKHFSIFYTREDLETSKPARELEIATRTGKYEEEGWRVRKNGSIFWANVIITALFNEQNELVGFSKVVRDLSEWKAREETLKQSEERYRSLVEQVSDYGIFLLDEKGRIISWNEGARKIKGYQAKEIIGKYFSIFYSEEDILSGKPAHELVVARTAGKYEEEGWRIRKDGTRFWANIIITAVYDKKGDLIGFSKVTRDLTERKEAERALRDSNEQYRILAEELRATNSELSYANQELEQFTSIVSHDLQEPIRTIKSFLQLIDMKLSSGQYQDLKTYIGKSILAANRMRELIHNLLHYSQLSRGELLEEEIDVDSVLNEVLQNLRSAIESARAEVKIITEVKTISADRVQLVQLIQNLLANALKFVDDNVPRITIRVEEVEGVTRFAVSDNGIGIAQADMTKVFDIFRRLNSKKEYPGTGIGLAICKKIVDRHHGAIWLDSLPGKGTTFYFTLGDESKARIPDYEEIQNSYS